MQMLFLLSFFSLAVNVCVCVPVVISVDPSRPTALYQGPPTNRRDPRNNYRPFKSIIVTSKPFGFDSKNQITQNTVTTSTTSSPLLGIAPPTIPFFTISCTVGSSCSQIIQSPSRNLPTPRPTFKPYTKGFNRTLNYPFLPTVLTLNLGVRNSSTTTPQPLQSLWRTRTTTTTQSPLVMTTTLPTSDFVTATVSEKSRPVASGANQWKWPESSNVLPEKRKPEVSSNIVSDTASAVSAWNLKGSQSVASHQSEWPIRKSSYWSKFPTSTNNHNSNEANDIKATTFRPIQSSTPPYTRGWMAMLAASLAGFNNQHRVQSNNPQVQVVQTQQVRKNETMKNPKPQMSSEVKYIIRPQTPPVKAGATRTVASDGKVAGELILTQSTNHNEHHLHEIISTKGNKISLITGPNTRKKINNIAPQNQHVVIPPEVSVSSHAIGLRVKPKSLSAPFLETIQGVSVETDGENVNLSKLIMRDHPKDMPRPSRYLSSFGNRGWIRQI